MVIKVDYLIVGGGIIGLTVAYELNKKSPNAKIAIIEKESDVAQHASGRNSGVIHAGFYYTKDSLKAKFTVDGNKQMREFCLQNSIKINESKKVVVALDEEELKGLYELEKRGDINGVELKLIDEKELSTIDKNIKTYKKALLSPSTASVNPKEVCFKLKEILEKKGVNFYFNSKLIKIKNNLAITSKDSFEFNYLINSAGLYADRVAQMFDIAKNYTMLPFKGIYLKYLGDKNSVKTNIYPVPNLANPFLGVHFTKTIDNSIKIGPTAIPAFWREHYSGIKNFKLNEFLEIISLEMKLFILNSFNFRNLALHEMKKYSKSFFINEAKKMVYKIEDNFEPMPAGIRAQLLNKDTNELVMDFFIEKSNNSIHILNAVSPAFTCSFAFAKYIVEKIENV